MFIPFYTGFKSRHISVIDFEIICCNYMTSKKLRTFKLIERVHLLALSQPILQSLLIIPVGGYSFAKFSYLSSFHFPSSLSMNLASAIASVRNDEKVETNCSSLFSSCFIVPRIASYYWCNMLTYKCLCLLQGVGGCFCRLEKSRRCDLKKFFYNFQCVF